MTTSTLKEQLAVKLDTLCSRVSGDFMRNEPIDETADQILSLITSEIEKARKKGERSGMAWVHATVFELTDDPKLIDKLDKRVQSRLEQLSKDSKEEG